MRIVIKRMRKGLLIRELPGRLCRWIGPGQEYDGISFDRLVAVDDGEYDLSEIPMLPEKVEESDDGSCEEDEYAELARRQFMPRSLFRRVGDLFTKFGV